MNITLFLRPLRTILALLTGVVMLAACNSKDDSETVYTPSSSVAVTSFTLSADSDVAANLDSVFFSIDLDGGVIANADSLPKGADISKLVPVITFPSTVSSAVITMTGGIERTGEVNYKTNPTDSIDFTGAVTLRLIAEDGSTERTYALRVNVHTVDGDTLAWDRLGRAPLPSRTGRPVAQRTVMHDNRAVCLVAESDGSYTLASTDAPADGNWRRDEAMLPADADVRSFTATDSDFYILTSDGSLYGSADGIQWSDTGARWNRILGGYGDALLGMRSDADGMWLTSWPATCGIAETPAPAGFPVSGYSDLQIFTSRWSTRPTAFLTGGLTAGGSATSATWGFDGIRWASISENMAPAVTDATVIPYFNLVDTSTGWVKSEFEVHLLMGGRLADGTPNREVWITYDNGVNWRKADTHLQLPEDMEWTGMADGITLTTRLDADLNEGWVIARAPHRSPMMRVKTEISGDRIYWDCPYMYLFGGLDENGILLDRVMRGVLVRLEFTPLI